MRAYILIEGKRNAGVSRLELQSDDELLDARHPQSNILCAGRTGEDIHVDA